ncbi:MAG: RluA family pseudouridine synthase [Treponema sp.]|nr:RluA family pseudouridine synthase [Candidatus Treponema equifaecale]
MKAHTIVSNVKISLNELLRKELPAILEQEVSNSKVRRLIVAGSVSVNGKQIRIPAYSVFPKSQVTVLLDEEKLFYEKQPDDIDYELTQKDILFEDDSIIVVNKPTHFPTEAGMVGSRDNLHDAIVRFLFERQKITAPNAKNPPYVGIMHRLDRDTSGVILFTKTRAANAPCHEMFEKHTARKEYVAVVTASPKSKKFIVDFPMGRISQKSQAAKWGKLSEKDGGLHSLTEFELIEGKTLVQSHPMEKSSSSDFQHQLIIARPHTGRTHQIRVHLASAGCPILGDTLYGGKSYDRIMLHAKKLTFPHPVTGKEMSVEAPVPEEFI